MDWLDSLWAEIPVVEAKIRAALPFQTEGVWTWIVGLVLFTIIVTVSSRTVGWVARKITEAIMRR